MVGVYLGHVSNDIGDLCVSVLVHPFANQPVQLLKRDLGMAARITVEYLV
jgi:hypothetical protein